MAAEGTVHLPRHLRSPLDATFVMRNADRLFAGPQRSIHRWRPRSAWAARCASGPVARSALFPPVGRNLNVDETRSYFAPYADFALNNS